MMYCKVLCRYLTATNISQTLTRPAQRNICTCIGTGFKVLHCCWDRWVCVAPIGKRRHWRAFVGHTSVHVVPTAGGHINLQHIRRVAIYSNKLPVLSASFGQNRTSYCQILFDPTSEFTMAIAVSAAHSTQYDYTRHTDGSLDLTDGDLNISEPNGGAKTDL
jgi:hypothetical protein